MRFALGLTTFCRATICTIGAICTVSATITSAAGADNQVAQMLRGLDPATRFQQACGIEAMNRIKKEAAPYRPERAVTDAVSEAKVKGDTMEGDGGAFRSGGKWYQFSFTCKASPDRMNVVFFSYKIGAAIPEGKWESYGLWN